MKLQPPLVTVITPAYNQADYLVETMESILGQEYPNLEYIVLNDGSSDATPDILDQYTGRIIWETQENMGEPRTVNRGFSMANGKYVMVVNADDPLLPNAISKQVALMEANPDVVATYPDFVIIDEHSNETEKIYLPDYDHGMAICRAWCIPGPGALIRRETIQMVGGRNIKYRFNSDMAFWYQLGLHGDILRIPEFLAIRREHSEARGIALQSGVGKEIITVIEDLFLNTELPEQIKMRYKEALSSAYFEAGARADIYGERRKHFLCSFRIYPMNWVRHSYYWSLWKFGALLLPEFIYNSLRPLFRKLKN